MNKEEYNQIIDEVYENYCKSFDAQSEIESHSFDTGPMTKIMFVEKIKTLDWFSEKWGLKIEERELSLVERGEWDSKKDNVRNTWGQTIQTFTPNEVRIWLNEKNVPTKLITITYNNETIESYE